VTGFDFFACALLVASGILGLIRGLFREALALIAYVAAFAIAIWWGPVIYSHLDMIETSFVRMALAYGVLFVLALISLGLLGKGLSALVASVGLSAMDHTLGGLFGLVRGFLVLLALVALAGYTPLPQDPWWHDAMFSGTLINALQGLRHWLPPELAAWIPY